MALNGTFFDATSPSMPAEGPVAFPARNPNGKSAQGFVSDYVLNTAFEAGFKTGNTLNITKILGDLLNVTVTTDNMGLVVPEILTKYGSGKAVALSGAFVKAPSSASFDSTINTVKLNLAVTVQVEGETAIQVEFDEATAAAIFHTSASSVITGKVSTYTVGTVSNFKTSLGMTAAAFQAEVQDVVNKYIDIVNANLTTGVVIPTIFGIEASVAIDCGKGFIAGGIDLTPAHFEKIQSMWVAYKQTYDDIESGVYTTEKYYPSFVEEEGFAFLQ